VLERPARLLLRAPPWMMGETLVVSIPDRIIELVEA
jgi:hypothetical protein